MPVTRRTRFEVLRRDGNRCRYCILERFIDGEQHRVPDRFKLADKAA